MSHQRAGRNTGGRSVPKGDRFEMETPSSSGADTILYTPTMVDGGMLVIDEAATGAYVAATDTIFNVGILPPAMAGVPVPEPGGVETLVYDGEAGNDALTIFGDRTMPGTAVAGAAGPDIFTHTPGSDPDGGTVLVNSLLAIQYSDLGLTGALTVNGLAGTDTLNVVGTGQNDTINVVATTGTVQHTLSSGAVRVPINQANVEGLVIDALAGDDHVTINAPQPYTTIGVNGGDPSSGSDVLTLNGAAATAENVTIAPVVGSSTAQTITGLGAAINVTGVELISYTANQPAGGCR